MKIDMKLKTNIEFTCVVDNGELKENYDSWSNRIYLDDEIKKLNLPDGSYEIKIEIKNL